MLSALIGLAGGAANFGLGAANSAIQYGFNKRLQDDAQEHQIHMYRNQHQWRVQDLRAAGLNPILATHGGSAMPSASSSSVSLPSSSFDLADSLDKSERFFSKVESRIKHEKLKKEAQLLDAQINSAKSVAESNIALAEKYSAEAFNTDLNSAFEYSRDMLNLRKRELYNRGTPNLYQGYGDFKDAIDKFNNYAPYHILDKGESVWNIKHSPRRNGKNRFYFEN